MTNSLKQIFALKNTVWFFIVPINETSIFILAVLSSKSVLSLQEGVKISAELSDAVYAWDETSDSGRLSK